MKETDDHTVLITAGTFVGYTIILVGLFAGNYWETIWKCKCSIWMSSVEIRDTSCERLVCDRPVSQVKQLFDYIECRRVYLLHEGSTL